MKYTNSMYITTLFAGLIISIISAIGYLWMAKLYSEENESGVFTAFYILVLGTVKIFHIRITEIEILSNAVVVRKSSFFWRLVHRGYRFSFCEIVPIDAIRAIDIYNYFGCLSISHHTYQKYNILYRKTDYVPGFSPSVLREIRLRTDLIFSVKL